MISKSSHRPSRSDSSKSFVDRGEDSTADIEIEKAIESPET
jgi:hypothetical protein